ncbi:hypothetical protein M432DRAFT_652689 [Thermoascus aurantiacus ATCC 26904]
MINHLLRMPGFTGGLSCRLIWRKTSHLFPFFLSIPQASLSCAYNESLLCPTHGEYFLVTVCFSLTPPTLGSKFASGKRSPGFFINSSYPQVDLDLNSPPISWGKESLTQLLAASLCLLHIHYQAIFTRVPAYRTPCQLSRLKKSPHREWRTTETVVRPSSPTTRTSTTSSAPTSSPAPARLPSTCRTGFGTSRPSSRHITVYAQACAGSSTCTPAAIVQPLSGPGDMYLAPRATR